MGEHRIVFENLRIEKIFPMKKRFHKTTSKRSYQWGNTGQMQRKKKNQEEGNFFYEDLFSHKTTLKTESMG